MRLQDALREAFGAAPVKYRVEAYLRSALPPPPRDVALVTQGSMDRLPRLREQASMWHGTLSVAIYIRPDEQSGAEHAAALDAIRSLYNEVESRQQCRLIVSLLYAIDPANAEHEFDTLYPINALRNVAIRQTEARLIMVIDIDFVPSENFWEYLSDESRYSLLVERAETLRHVWALVSLELHEGDYMPLPTTRKQVAAGLATSSLVVAEAYLNPAAHMPVGIQEWLQQDGIYGPLDTAENLSFEPFVLGARLLLPLYDERFRGYGWDKTTHAAQLRREGFTYHMLPHHFVVARYHQPTPTAIRMFHDTGDAPRDTLLRMRMEWLYNSFILQLDEPGYQLPQVSA